MEHTHYQGYEETIARAGLTPLLVTHDVASETPSAEDWTRSAEAAAHGILKHPEHPTAVGCYTDYEAVALFWHCQRLGIRIPEELSIVGRADLAVATAVRPELTTLRVPAEEAGHYAAHAALRLIDGASVTDRSLKHQLVVRGTTAVCSER